MSSGDIHLTSQEHTRKVRTAAESHGIEELVKDTERQTPAMKKTVSPFTDRLGVTDAANSEVSYADASPRAAASGPGQSYL